MARKTWNQVVNRMEEALYVQDMTAKELLEHVNKKSKHGSTSNTIASLLQSRPQFKKMGTASVFYTDSWVTVAVWGMDRE